MDKLRLFFKWIRSHRIISLLVAVVIFGSIFLSRTFVERSQGEITDPLKVGNIVDAVYGIGTVTAARSYSIKPGVVTSISSVYVKEGDYVRKGDRLIKIDDNLYRAPFDGVINFLPFKISENVFAQVPVLVITDLMNRYLVVSLEQQGALRVNVGQRAKVSFDSLRSQSYDGTVEAIYSYNGNFLARIKVDDLPKQILPDMTADVGIIVREIKNVLLVPTLALEGNSVWVKKNRGLPTQEIVKLGIVDGVMAEIVSGNIGKGDRLIVRKKIRL